MSSFKVENPDYRAWIERVLAQQSFMVWLGVELGATEPGICELLLGCQPGRTRTEPRLGRQASEAAA